MARRPARPSIPDLLFDNAIEIKNNTTSALNITGNVNTNGYNLTLEGTGSGTTTLSTGAISGTGGVIKNDSGTAVLSGDNSYSGGTTLNAGTLVVGSTTRSAITPTPCPQRRHPGLQRQQHHRQRPRPPGQRRPRRHRCRQHLHQQRNPHPNGRQLHR
jgi:autotransporter-associated beta strand protein